RFVQVRVNGGHGGQIDDHRPSDFLPNSCANDNAEEILGLSQEGYGLEAKPAKNRVDNPLIGQNFNEDSADNNPGQKVGQIKQGLHGPFKPFHANFIQQQRQKQRS